MFNSRPISSEKISEILVWIIFNMGWVVVGFEAGVVFIVEMVDLNMFGLVGLDCNKAVFFDS
jgi:hypothetical protein